jgi:hypothetical protein
MLHVSQQWPMSTAVEDPLDRLVEATKVRWVPGYCPHAPHAKQHAFLWLDNLEALYGGAAGGGKSDALLMAALQYVDVPEYAAILFRRQYSDLALPGALMSRAHEWLAPTDAQWNDIEKTWTFPSGATLTFGYLKTDKDKYRYQSAEFQFVGFDELTQFPRSDYIYLFSRLRRLEGSNIPIRMRSATNPGGLGHLWVKNRFIVKEDDTGPEEPVFIPARLKDNPSIDQTLYLFALEQLDEETRQQLLLGDWDAREPGNWVIPDPTWIDAAENLGEQYRYDPPTLDNGDTRTVGDEKRGRKISGGLDWGEHTYALTVWPFAGGSVFIPYSPAAEEIYKKHTDPVESSESILKMLLSHEVPIEEIRYDAAGVQSMRTFMAIARSIKGLERLKSKSIAFNKYKRESINYLRLLFRRTAEGKDTHIIAIDPRNVELCRMLRTWELKTWENRDSETDEIVKKDDHGPDALVAGIAPIAARNRKFLEELIQDSYGYDPDHEKELENLRSQVPA